MFMKGNKRLVGDKTYASSHSDWLFPFELAGTKQFAVNVTPHRAIS